MTDLKWDLDQLTESFLHPILVPGGIVAQDQVEPRLEVTLSILTLMLEGVGVMCNTMINLNKKGFRAKAPAQT